MLSFHLAFNQRNVPVNQLLIVRFEWRAMKPTLLCVRTCSVSVGGPSRRIRKTPKFPEVQQRERRELQFLWLRRIDRVREFLHYNRESRGGGANGCAVLCVFRVRACVCTRLWIILFERNCWTRSRSHQTVWALISMNAIFFQFFFLRIHGLTLFFCFIKK